MIKKIQNVVFSYTVPEKNQSDIKTNLKKKETPDKKEPGGNKKFVKMFVKMIIIRDLI
jgi:hypothetical protein